MVEGKAFDRLSLTLVELDIPITSELSQRLKKLIIDIVHFTSQAR